jgi:2-polyprenyl-6-methoxyphenol hydroxylase-like FAD-dependent oxidoreductase
MGQSAQTQPRREASCCVVGGGPAGMMVGYLLARAGVEVIVLEKHADFFRDFRGDTIHPSTLDLMAELGLLEEFLQLPHTRTPQLQASLDGKTFTVADFRHLPTRCKFIAMMPQWDFLNFIATEAKRYSTFRLQMNAEVTNVLERGNRIVGVQMATEQGEGEVLADLIVAADGRHSTVRQQAVMSVREFRVPFDALWFRLPKNVDAPPTLGYFRDGRVVGILDRGDYFQCGAIIPKGEFEEIKAQGLEAFREHIARTAPILRSVVNELREWEQVKLLSVRMDRLERWYRPGLLCIGDAAHAMSPVGGVGVNYAIQDAVAAANLLASKLRQGDVSLADLRQVQRRREWPVRLMQTLQRLPAAAISAGFEHPGAGRQRLQSFVTELPLFQRIVGRIIGLGFRREHVRTPDLGAVIGSADTSGREQRHRASNRE